MKGIIIEKSNDNSVILLSDGSIKKIKSTFELEIGSVVNVNDTISSSDFYIRKLVSMAASVLLVASIGIGVYAWKNPVQYISIDINPSLELSVNCFQRIISINSLNDDGWKLVETVSLKAQTYESGINRIINSAKNLGYINGEGDVLISISSEDEKLNERTQITIREKVTDNIEVMTFDTEEHNTSLKKGLSPGKNNIIEKVIESGIGLDKNDLVDIPVNELIKKLDESKKQIAAVEILKENQESNEEKKKQQEELKKKEEAEREERKQALEQQKAEAERQKEEQKKQQEELKKKEEAEKEEHRQALEQQKAEAERRKEEQKKQQEELMKKEEKEKEEHRQALEKQKVEAEKRKEEQKKKQEALKEKGEKEKEEWKQEIERQRAEAERRKEEYKKQHEELEKEEEEKKEEQKNKQNNWKKELEKLFEEKKQEWKQIIEDIKEISTKNQEYIDNLDKKSEETKKGK